MPTNKSTNPLVSVVIPAYNAEKYINSAINSVQTQTIKNIEIIVVNDGSTDNTQSIVEQLQLADPRISLYTQKNSGKPAIPRNFGCTKAKGKYIAFLDADDLMLPDKLKDQLNLFKKCDDITLIFHDSDHINSDNTILSSAHLSQKQFLLNAAEYLTPQSNIAYISNHDFYRYASTHPIGILMIQVMLKRDVIFNENLWFSEDLIIGEDMDLWLRIFMTHRIGYIDKVLSQYRKHTDNITQKPEGMILSHILVGERNLRLGRKHLTRRDKNKIKHHISLEYRKLAYHCYVKYDRLQAKNYYIKSFLLHPSLRHLLSIFKCLYDNPLENNHTKK